MPYLNYDVIILGGGIAGLSAAIKLKKAGLSILLLETSNRLGGVINSQRKGDYLLEYGPNTVLPNPHLMELIENAQLEKDILLAPTKLPRYIQYRGKLCPAPMSPAAFFKTPLLGPGGKLRLLMEPFVPKLRGDKDETLAEFSRRRLGFQATGRLLAPFVTGVWAGDVHKLSAQATFPQLTRWEKEHGSLLRGILSEFRRRPKAKKVPKGLLSFPEGLETLPRRIQEILQDHIRTGVELEGLERDRYHPMGREWLVRTSQGDFEAKKLVMALPPTDAARLLRPLYPDVASNLSDIPTIPLVIVHAAAKWEDVRHSMKGFGYLTIPEEKRAILGCLFSSSLFPNRAPHGQHLLTVLMGGARSKEKIHHSDKEITEAVEMELKATLGLSSRLTLLDISRHERALPQYTLGHTQRIKGVMDLEKSVPSLKLIGNYLNGVLVGDVVRLTLQKMEEWALRAEQKKLSFSKILLPV